jgi:excinuclease UvrABC nuclease subunit
MAKLPSFQFYPADWRKSYWISYDFEKYETEKIAKLPGCYVVYGDEALIYIGQASNVALRISNHRIKYGYSSYILCPWGSFRSVIIKVRYGVRYGDWLAREARLIAKIQPPFNCIGSTKPRGKKHE